MCFEHRQQLIYNGKTKVLQNKRELLLTILSMVIKAIDPYNAVNSHVKDSSLFFQNMSVDTTRFKRIFALSFGKGSVGMAQAVCDNLSVEKGLAITNDAHASVNHSKVETIVGGHPLPNEQSILGAKKAQQLLSECKPDDLVIILISGGGSALLASPRISLSDLQNTTKLLLASGATIQEINTIRKHLSTVKGGQLIQSLPCQVVSFVISDVVGDPLEFIASGPTVGDSTTFSDAFTILEKYHLWARIPESVREIIEQGRKGLIPETPFPNNPVFDRVSNYIIANNSLACENAFNQGKELGFNPVILSHQITGEARIIGKELVKEAYRLQKNQSFNMFISGGEPTVTLTGDGKGGRNQELALAVVKELKGSDGVFCSFGTDGIDGMSPAAGAIVDGNTDERAQKIQLDTQYYLKNNDSFTFFSRLNDTLITGPTGTNVMDIQILLL